MISICHRYPCNDPECDRDHPLECVRCGSINDVTSRYSNEDGESEPMCTICWGDFDHSAEERFANIQFAFYNPPMDRESIEEYWARQSELFAPLHGMDRGVE